MANNEKKKPSENVVGRQNNEDQDNVPNVGDELHNVNHTSEWNNRIQLEFQNHVTQFSMNLKSLASGNILYDDFELSQHSRLYTDFQASKEGNLESIKDLFPGIEVPVLLSVEQDG